MTKKTKISLYLIIALLLLFPQEGWSYGWEEEAKLETPTVNPYSYLPMDIRQKVNCLPN